MVMVLDLKQIAFEAMYSTNISGKNPRRALDRSR
jgi:hypothetical protein